MKNLYKQILLFCLFAIPAGIMAQVTVNSAGLLEVQKTNEAIRIDGSGNGWLSFYDGATIQGWLWQATAGDMELMNVEAGQLRLGTNNTDQVFIESDGDVGIGGVPGLSHVQLDVFNGDIRMNESFPFLYLNSTTTGNQGIIFETNGSDNSTIWHETAQDILHISNGPTSADHVNILADGKVGIGTNTVGSSWKMAIDDGTASTGINIISSGRRGIDFNDGNSNVSWLSQVGNNLFLNNTAGYLYLGAGPNDNIRFNVGGEKMRIDNSGNVGIGTTSPSELLDVNGNMEVNGDISMPYSGGNDSKISQTTGNMQIQKSRVAGNALIDIDALPLDGTSAASFRFFRNTVTTGETKFDVHWGDGTNGVNCRIAGNANSFLAKDYGNVGIGIGNGSYKLHVNGDAGKPGGGTWANASDRRLKKNIEDFTDGLEKVRNIHPVSYQYNGMAGLPDGGDTYVGIIAQEMQEVAPYTIDEFTYIETELQGQKGFEREVVTKEETYLNYDGTAVTYMLVNAVKELADDNDEKDERIEELETELEAMKEAIAEIQAQIGGQETDSEIDVKHEKDVVLTGTGNVAELAQNQPNPFNENTVIKYYLPDGTTGAQMNIFNNEGKLLKTVKIDETGQGQINLQANSLPAGNYMYQLTTDSGVIGTKTMVLVK